jgi:antiviral helicase SKI2
MTPKLVEKEDLASLGLDAVPSREQIYDEIEERLLLPRDRLAPDWLSKYQVWVSHPISLSHSTDLRSRYWDEQISIPSLLSFNPSPPPTSISLIRSGLSGHVTGYSEVATFLPSLLSCVGFLNRSDHRL